MRDNFLVFGSPLIGQEEKNEVLDSLNTGWLGTGPKVKKFEDQFGIYKGTKNTLAVNSCTAALHLSLLAAELTDGDEVITTPMTFCATVNAIIHAGGTPVLADVDPLTMNLDPNAVETAITARTKAIVVVHFGGRPCEMDEFQKIALRHNLLLIEDCAHSIESIYKDKPIGTIGDFGCFSFYATKNIVTGEGGLVISRNPEHLQRLKALSLHGMSLDAWNRFGSGGYKHYDVIECGYKYNMMDLQAAIGLHQLNRIEEMWARRKDIWNEYSTRLLNLGLILPESKLGKGSKHAYHLYPVILDSINGNAKRDIFLSEMTKLKIGVGVHYRSIAEHSYYQDRFKWRPEQWPEAFRIGQRTVSLPLSPKMSDVDTNDVIEAVQCAIKVI